MTTIWVIEERPRGSKKWRPSVEDTPFTVKRSCEAEVRRLNEFSVKENLDLEFRAAKYQKVEAQDA